MTQSLTVTETAAFMTDWAAFLDDVSYQDPEVALARGHRAVPLPVGLPSAVICQPDAAAVLAQGPAVRRVWTASGAVSAGAEVRTSSAVSDGIVETRFDAPGFTAVELLEVASGDELDHGPDAAAVFRTSAPVGPTRVRAFAWGMNDLLAESDAGRFDRWGSESRPLHALSAALLMPTVLAVHVLGVDSGARPESVRVETVARVAPPPSPSRYHVHVEAGGNALVVADGVVVASVELRATPREQDALRDEPRPAVATR